MMEQLNFSRHTACLLIALMIASQPCQANEPEQNSRSLFLQNIVMQPSYHSATAPASVASPVVAPVAAATGMPTPTPTVAGTPGPTHGAIPVITTPPTTSAVQVVNTATVSPTITPTATVTSSPTIKPTPSPTDKPTSSPTVMASGHPTTNPSQSPTPQPSVIPTKAPTPSPSIAPSSSPSMAPSQVPSPAPTVTPDCIDDLSKVHDMEINIRDTSRRRKYWLCPDTVFNMGTLDPSGTIVNGQSFIMLRPNVIYQCGLDGSRSNNCTIQGGDFGVTSFYGVYEGIQETVDNAIIQGLTFVGQNLFSVVLEAAGDVTFQDCVFEDQESMAPVLIQWNGEAPLESVSRRLRSSKHLGNAGFQGFHQRVQDQISGTRHLEGDDDDDEFDDDDDAADDDDDHVTEDVDGSVDEAVDDEDEVTAQTAEAAYETLDEAVDDDDDADATVHTAETEIETVDETVDEAVDDDDDDDATAHTAETENETVDTAVDETDNEAVDETADEVVDEGVHNNDHFMVHTTELRHTVTFKQCIFRNNRANKQYGLPGIIENTYRSELVIEHCLFENNDYGETTNPSPFGYAIRSFGPLTVEASCFNDNEFLQDAPVVVYNDIYSSINNYATPKPDHLYCGLMALYNSNRTGLVTPASSLIDEGTPDCVESDVDTCVVNLAPTLAPSAPPTMEPTELHVSASTSRIQISSMVVAALSSMLVLVSLW